MRRPLEKIDFLMQTISDDLWDILRLRIYSPIVSEELLSWPEEAGSKIWKDLSSYLKETGMIIPPKGNPFCLFSEFAYGRLDCSSCLYGVKHGCFREDGDIRKIERILWNEDGLSHLVRNIVRSSVTRILKDEELDERR